MIVRIEPHPDGPSLLIVRERWTSTGLESDPLYLCESSGFEDEADMLRQVAHWFDLDDRWVTVTPGVEYWHANGTAAEDTIEEGEPDGLTC